MIVFRSLSLGWKKLRRNLWLVGIVYLISFLLFLLIALPLLGVFKGALAGSEVAAKASLALDPNSLLPALLPHSDLFKAAFSLPFVLFGGLLFLLLSLFFAGGAISVFVKEEKGDICQFFAGGGRYFLRFLRLFLFSLIFLGVILFLRGSGNKLISRIFLDSPNEPLVFYSKLALNLVILFLLLFVDMVFDYAKIGMVVGEKKGAFRSTLSALSFSFRNFSASFSLYLLLFLVGGAVTYGVHLLGWRVLHQSAPLLLFLVYQLYFLFRVALTLAFYSSECSLYSVRRR